MDTGAVWTVLAVSGSPFASVAEAKAQKGSVDEGSEGRWKADRSAPGNGKTRVQWQCNNHVNCPVRLQATRVFEMGGFGFRVRGQHSSEQNAKRRANAAMTFEQEASIVDALATGGRPAGLRTSLTLKAIRAASVEGKEAPKRPEGGLEGKQNSPPIPPRPGSHIADAIGCYSCCYSRVSPHALSLTYVIRVLFRV